MQETWVGSLGWEDPLEEETATQAQYYCLENPMDRGAWWATVHGAAESNTTEQLSAHTQTRVQAKCFTCLTLLNPQESYETTGSKHCYYTYFTEDENRA